MRDPTIPNVKNRKKFMFYDTSERQTKLRIRCNFDGFTQSQFFRMMITGYIENNELSSITQIRERATHSFGRARENTQDPIYSNLFELTRYY